MTANRSITETPNSLTSDIDLATPVQIVRLLRSTDAQIFSGYGGYPGLYDPETLDSLAQLAVSAARILRSPRGRVVISGAGTSGRLAMFTARIFNHLGEIEDSEVVSDTFRYTIAGGDAALMAAQEGAEDDPHQGVIDLEAAAEGADEVFYVGITCGLSAPYVAGQLDHMLSGKIKGHSVLLGFNPVEHARDIPIEGWNKTFLQVALKATESENATILNPIVGPEPITGSTRMKSGSATKILLEAIFHAARAASLDEDDLDSDQLYSALIPFLKMILSDYENATREAYAAVHELAALIQTGGESLRNGGHIYYIGGTGPEPIHTCADDHCSHDPEDHPDLAISTEAGIIGLIDASECPPTYGAAFNDVRGFVAGGWDALLGERGDELTSRGDSYKISIDDFRSEVLPSLGQHDLVVFLGSYDERDQLVREVRETGARTAAVTLLQSDAPPAVDILIELQPTLSTISAAGSMDDEEEDEDGVDTAEKTMTPGAEAEPEILSGPTQLAYKLILNALTTGAHLLAGKVYGNRMVDLKISNNKLFYRTVGIITDLIGCSKEQAEESLIRSVYESDLLSDAQRNAPVSEHIEVSKSISKVVPKALLIATGKFSYADATSALTASPVVRTAIGDYVQQ